MLTPKKLLCCSDFNQRKAKTIKQIQPNFTCIFIAYFLFDSNSVDESVASTFVIKMENKSFQRQIFILFTLAFAQGKYNILFSFIVFIGLI